MDEIIVAGSRAIIIAEDDASIKLTPLADDAVDASAIRQAQGRATQGRADTDHRLEPSRPDDRL